MNMIAAFRRQPLFLKLARAMLARLFKAPTTKARPRYVNIGEFTPHLQRDMGFVDGRGAPGADGGPDIRELETRDWMR